MKDWMKTLFLMSGLGRRRTVDQITRGLSRMVDNLNTLSAQLGADADAAEARAEKARAEAKAALKESRRALARAAKIEAAFLSDGEV